MYRFQLPFLLYMNEIFFTSLFMLYSVNDIRLVTTSTQNVFNRVNVEYGYKVPSAIRVENLLSLSLFIRLNRFQ